MISKMITKRPKARRLGRRLEAVEGRGRRLSELKLEDCYFRMMFTHEIGRGCGFDVDFSDHQGNFVVWGSAREQVDGFGNAVSPPVGQWIGAGLRAVLHGEPVSSLARVVD